jgi:hypothetical protein
MLYRKSYLLNEKVGFTHNLETEAPKPSLFGYGNNTPVSESMQEVGVLVPFHIGGFLLKLAVIDE